MTRQWAALLRAADKLKSCESQQDRLDAVDHLSAKIAIWMAVTVDPEHFQRVGVQKS